MYHLFVEFQLQRFCWICPTNYNENDKSWRLWYSRQRHYCTLPPVPLTTREHVQHVYNGNMFRGASDIVVKDFITICLTIGCCWVWFKVHCYRCRKVLLSSFLLHLLSPVASCLLLSIAYCSLSCPLFSVALPLLPAGSADMSS